MGLLADDTLVESTAVERAEQFLASIGDYEDRYHGRGIVVCAGGPTYFTNAWIAISLLRHVGCRLPVQLWYLGREELDEYMEGLMSPLGVECVDATAVRAIHPARILRGWEVKPFAILHSPYREVMLVDADNFVAGNPEYLFESWEYRQYGAILWPDSGRLSPDNPAWSVFGVPYADEPEVESGQLVVDKMRCWKALWLTKHYNDYSDFYYRYVHGDKETFHFAFRKVGQPYAMTPHAMRFEHGTFLQHDFAGQVVFQHRNHSKWNLGDANPAQPGCRFDAECAGFLETLRDRWDGTVGGSQQDRGPIRSVAHARTMLTSTVYRRAGDSTDYCPMTFLEDGRMGIGATETEQTWSVYRSGSHVALEIGSERGPSCVMLSNGEGWQGASGCTLSPIAGKAGAFPQAALSWGEFLDKVLAFTEPLSQNTASGNLGFGWLYYGLARNLAPEVAIVIGSARGFAPLCIARALQDNGRGEVLFIDPGYAGSGDPAWDGRGHWQVASEVEKWFRLFGCAGIIRHLKCRSDDALPQVQTLLAGKRAALLLIDGAHTHEQSLRDFDNYAPLLSDGVVLFHDATNPNCGVAETLRVIRSRGRNIVTLDIDAGLAMVQTGQPPQVDDKWGYLTSASDRGELIMEHLAPLLRDDDRVFEAYCGFSPLNPYYASARVFGFDIDPVVIGRLRLAYPQHRWAQIDEGQLAWADLPDQADVLVGLGLSAAHCAWDPQLARRNVRFLLGLYRPRVCLFETAAEYYGGAILDELRLDLERAGYACREASIATNMTAFGMRRILIGTPG